MDRKRNPARTAQAVSEAINGLCLFLCGPSFAGLKADAPELLRQWDAEYAPVLGLLDHPAAAPTAGGRASAGSLGAALARISAIARTGFDPERQEELAPLRAAVRDALTAVGIPVAAPGAAGAGVCELHGAGCPVAAQGRR